MMKCDACGKELTGDEVVNISGHTICAGCKPDVLLNIRSGVAAPAGGVSPEEALKIRSQLKRLNILSFVFAVPGLVLQFGSAAAGNAQVGVLFQMVGLVLLIVGLGMYSRMKGRSWAWGLVGLLSIIGLLVLILLGVVCRHCGKKQSHRTKTCGACGSPVSLQ